MLLYLDLDTRRILTTPTRPASRLEFKRRDNDILEMQFVRSGAVVEVPTGTTARYGLKPLDDYDAGFLSSGDFSKTGTGTAALFTAAFSLNTTPIATAFADEPKSVAAMLEVEWTTGSFVSSSLTLPITIHNDVIRGDEGAPATLPIFYTSETSDFLATQAQAESGQDNTKWMSPLRTAQAIAALAATDWDSINDKPATFAPSTHTHAIADTTGLQTALDGKAAASHTHPLADLTQSSATSGQVVTWSGTAWVPSDPSGGVTSYNDLTDVPASFPPSTHTHAASDITTGTLAIARIPTGTTSTTVCIGNDSRLSDARTPTAHTHGNITNAGAIGTTAGVPIITGTSGVLQAGSFGTTAGTFAEGSHTHTGFVTTSGGITAISVVSSMPASPVATTLYIVTT